MSTKGEYRVGIAFNPSNMDMVAKIKRAAADLIDLIETIPDGPAPGYDDDDQEVDIANYEWVAERNRLKALAMTSIEEAAMWAVKAATKPKP